MEVKMVDELFEGDDGYECAELILSPEEYHYILKARDVLHDMIGIMYKNKLTKIECSDFGLNLYEIDDLSSMEIKLSDLLSIEKILGNKWEYEDLATGWEE